MLARPDTSPPLAALDSANLSPAQGIIVKVLRKAYPNKVAAEQLMAVLYGGRADGGPSTGKQNLHVIIANARHRLIPCGWTIPKSRTGRGNTAEYRLEPVRTS